MPEYPYLATLPLDRLIENEENPNEQDERTFNATCESIQEEGWLQPMATVVPIEWDEQVAGSGEVVGRIPKVYEIVGGHHRVKAAYALGMIDGPCWVLDPEKFDKDRRDWNVVKMNMLTGKLNPEKFAAMYERMVQQYDAEVLQALMGFTSKDAFQKVYRGVKDALPKELQDALDAVKDEIRTIDDLSLVLNRLFAEFGDTLGSNMMVFSWAGKEVLWVRCSDALWAEVSDLAKAVADAKGDMSEVLLDALVRTKEM